MELAARLFARDGFHTTSVQAIVSGMNVGKGVFYWGYTTGWKSRLPSPPRGAQPAKGRLCGRPVRLYFSSKDVRFGSDEKAD